MGQLFALLGSTTTEWRNTVKLRSYFGSSPARQRDYRPTLTNIGADSTGAIENFAPVLTQEPGQTLGFAPVPFMAVL